MLNRRRMLGLAGLAPLGFAGCRREPEFARVDAALAPLIPPDAMGMACVRLDRIRKTGFQSRFIESRKIPLLEKFATQTGLNIRKDIWELLIVYLRGADAPLVLIRGKFGGSFGQEPVFDLPGLQKMSYKGYYIVYGEGPAVLFMNTGAAVAGRIDDLKRVVDQRDQKGWRSNQELISLAGTLPGTTPFWLVTSQGRELLPRVAGGGTLEAVQALAGSLGPMTLHTSLENGLSVTIRGGYPGADDAGRTAAALRGLLELARARAGAAAAEVLRGVRISQRETEVEVIAEVGWEGIPGLLGVAPGLMGD